MSFNCYTAHTSGQGSNLDLVLALLATSRASSCKTLKMSPRRKTYPLGVSSWVSCRADVSRICVEMFRVFSSCSSGSSSYLSCD